MIKIFLLACASQTYASEDVTAQSTQREDSGQQEEHLKNPFAQLSSNFSGVSSFLDGSSTLGGSPSLAAKSETVPVESGVEADTGEESEETTPPPAHNVYEDENVTYFEVAKLYRFRNGEWKERGKGEARLMEHLVNGRTRFLFRQEKTLKTVANFYVVDSDPYCQLQPFQHNDKCWTWAAHDYSDEELILERFALRFATPELANAFRIAFDQAKANNAKVGMGSAAEAGATQTDAGEATAEVEEAADALAASKLEEPTATGTNVEMLLAQTSFFSKILIALTMIGVFAGSGASMCLCRSRCGAVIVDEVPLLAD